MKRDFLVVNGEPCHELEPFLGEVEQLSQIMNPDLAKPVSELLDTLAEIRAVRNSFGRTTLHVLAAVEKLERRAIEIEKVCKQLWRDA